MPTFNEPKIKTKTPINKDLLIRLCRLASPGDIEHPDVPNYILKNEDFFASVVVVLENKSYRTTFLNDSFFTKEQVERGVKVGDRVICSVPSPNNSSGQEDVSGVVSSVDTPLGYSWLSAQIKVGAIPAVLSQCHLTFDVTSSVQAALELNGAVWNWPDLSKIVEKEIPEGVDTEHKAMLQAMQSLVGHVPMSKPVSSKHHEEIIEVALSEIQNIAKKVYAATGNIFASLSMLPICTTVTSTVTKSVLEWRIWLQSRSECYETAWIKSFLFKKLSDSLGPLFVGCDVAVRMLSEFKAELGE